MFAECLPLLVSEVQIFPVKPRDGLVAFASFIINRQLYIGNIGVHTRPCGGYRLVFPGKTLPNGKVIQCLHPITCEAGAIFLRAITHKFEAISKHLNNEDVMNRSKESGEHDETDQSE